MSLILKSNCFEMTEFGSNVTDKKKQLSKSVKDELNAERKLYNTFVSIYAHVIVYTTADSK